MSAHHNQRFRQLARQFGDSLGGIAFSLVENRSVPLLSGEPQAAGGLSGVERLLSDVSYMQSGSIDLRERACHRNRCPAGSLLIERKQNCFNRSRAVEHGPVWAG